MTRMSLAASLLLLSLSAPATPAEIPRPEAYFGHLPGADRTVIGYDALVEYLQIVDERSDRVRLHRVGRTAGGRDLVMLAISTPENLSRAARHREIAARLDDPRGLSPQEIDRLVAEGKVILCVTLNIHSDEIAVSQMSPEWVYDLATGGGDSPARYLEDVIVLLFPSLNPDGQVMVTNWYLEHCGTPHEGSELPWLYHPYAGHDNNRDWFMLNLRETRFVNRVLYQEWHPQVLLDQHQMGAMGPRIFVPPYADPISPNVHPLVHRGTLLLGSGMAMTLEQAGKAGVIYGYSFDAYWPGGMRSTPAWKNTIGILTETASARLMTPILIEAKKLRGGRKGLSEYRAQANFPRPWPGGWWHPRDIVEYALLVTNSALETCALHREDLLRNRATMSQDAVRRGETEAPYAFVIPPGQHDPGTAEKLVDVLVENGVEVHRTTGDGRAGSKPPIPAGSYIIRTAQPYRPFILEMMEPQTYPEVKTAPGSDTILAPYDVTAWTLPYLMGITSFKVDVPIETPLVAADTRRPEGLPSHGHTWVLSPRENDSYAAVLRLLRRGAEILQLMAPADVPGVGPLEAGTFLVRNPPQEGVEPVFENLKVGPRSLDMASATRIAGLDHARRLALPRIGVYQSWTPTTDEGWTRFVLDTFDFPSTVLHNADIQRGNLRGSFDVILFPDQSREEIVKGRSAEEDSLRPPPAVAGGLEASGVKALRAFVRNGGSIVALGDAVHFAIRDLGAPCRDAAERMSREAFSTPGTLFRASVNTRHVLAFGMPEEAMIFRTQDPVLTLPQGRGPRGAVVVRYAEEPVLVASGWARGTAFLERKGALIEVSSGKGKFVLFGFRPQFRGQTHGTYRLLFNALLDAGTGTR